MTGRKTKKVQDETLLMVGTKKGAFIFRSRDGRRTWKASGPFFRGRQIYHFTYDRRNGALLATVNNEQWGPTVSISYDMGETWKESKRPPKFPEGSGLSVARVWNIQPGSPGTPDRLYLGVEPACLFRSDDRGETWQVDEGLLNHSTRKDWQPGNGGLCLHTVLPDERDERKLHVGISAVGTLFTSDGGSHWEFQNKNVLADFFPGAKKYPLFGQCVHKIVRNSRKPDMLFQQNHCGVFRSRSNGRSWAKITGNLPSRFGFPIAIDSGSSRIFVVPLEGDYSRIPGNGTFSVYASDNEGNEWFPLNRGIPRPAYFEVLRDGMKTDGQDPCGVYFGTTTGHLYSSRNAGENWSCISDILPPIFSVEASAA
jgi:photosystem II stability/assembly factor-like uncharacterized protein